MWGTGEGDSPLHSNRQLSRARHTLGDNIPLFHARLQQLLSSARNKRLNDGRVPAGVDDEDAELGAYIARLALPRLPRTPRRGQTVNGFRLARSFESFKHCGGV